jgi:excisionase family DNA binding protein
LTEKRWISPRECAGYLSLHLISVYRLIAKKQIPAAKIGRAVRIDVKALEEKLTSQIEEAQRRTGW